MMKSAFSNKTYTTDDIREVKGQIFEKKKIFFYFKNHEYR